MAMTLTEKIIASVPDWALPYIENRDRSGMTDEDVAQVDRWLDDLKSGGKYKVCSVYVSKSDCDRTAFNRYPAFGLACATTECMITLQERIAA